MTTMFNQIILAGAATSDAEAKGKMTRFRLVYENPRTKNEEKLYIDVKTFGKLAETVSEYVTKGKNVIITGRLLQDEYEKDGQKKFFTYVIAEDVQFLYSGRKKEDETEFSSEDSEVIF